MQELQSKKNSLAKAVGQAKGKGEDASSLMAEATTLGGRMSELEKKLAEEDLVTACLSSLPNIPADDVPVGADEHGNKEVRQHGSKPTFAFTPKEHFSLGEALGMMDFERAAKISGARFVVLKSQLARLERALANFFSITTLKNLATLKWCHPCS